VTRAHRSVWRGCIVPVRASSATWAWQRISYRRAAEQGSDDGQLNLGRMYAEGVGVPRDLVQAYVWLSLAAARGRTWAERRRTTLRAEMSAAQLSAAEQQIDVISSRTR